VDVRRQTRLRIHDTILDWAHRGLLDDATAGHLAAQYRDAESGHRSLTRWLATLALLLLLSSGLGVVGLLLADLPSWLIALLLGALAAGCVIQGGRMVTAAERRRPWSGAVLLTVGLGMAHGALLMLYTAAGGEPADRAAMWLMLLVAAFALVAAYHFRLRWPLILGLVYLFHGIGSGHAYVGHGGYLADIVDERTMALAAALCAGFGLYHEHRLESGSLRRHFGFGHCYVIFGLLYLNLATWFLSLFPGGLAWVLVFTAVGVAQLVIGAALKDARFSGFGIVFLAIDLYTRLFESFWDRMSAGSFLFVAGLIGLGLGILFEWRARRAGSDPA
jgi:hypothetical protein